VDRLIACNPGVTCFSCCCAICLFGHLKLIHELQGYKQQSWQKAAPATVSHACVSRTVIILWHLEQRQIG
jgi:hypothetical protein